MLTDKEMKDLNIEHYDDEEEYVKCGMCGNFVHESDIREDMCGYCFRANVGDDY